MNVIVTCEFSQTVAGAFRARGHDAFSNDVLDTDGNPEWHIKGDALEAVKAAGGGGGYGLMVAHPPCTWICASGLHWNTRGRNGLTPAECEIETQRAIEFVEALWDAPIPRIAIENPIGCLPNRSKLGKATQIIQPWQFGHDASKATCLWLKGLMPLQPTKIVPPRIVEWPRGSGKMVKRWGNQTDSGQNRLPPSADRWALRSKTYQGIADAMAEQWG